jgi:hypothetical protein
VIRIALALLLILPLAGCPWNALVRERVPAQCDGQCFVPCASRAVWQGDPDSADTWDNLPATLEDSRLETRTCEVRRKACEQCLRRLDRERVIDLGAPK